MSLVTQDAPNFIAPAILHDGTIIDHFNLKKDIKNKLVVLFFWPMDFTFVCPTEIISFNKLYQEFKNRNTEIIGISKDSIFVHQAWKNISIKNGGIGNIQYPLISDIKGEIQDAYNIMHPKIGVALRASFLIDTKWIVRHEVVNDLPFGRNIQDMIRMIDSIQVYETKGEVCPANWKPGKPSMHPSQKGLMNYCNN